MKTMKKPVTLGIHGADPLVHQCDHIAFFWETEQQFKNAVGFLEAGIHGQDHCVIFGYDEANRKVMDILDARGINADHLVKTGRISVLTADKDGDKTLKKIGTTFQKALDRGAPMIRLLGNIGWHKPNWPNEADILAFEAKVTTAARAFPCVVVCMYDVNALPGKVILRGGIETHPVTIRGNLVRENPMYVAVDDFLKQLEKEK